jgi:hypothetical protein
LHLPGTRDLARGTGRLQRPEEVSADGGHAVVALDSTPAASGTKGGIPTGLRGELGCERPGNPAMVVQGPCSRCGHWRAGTPHESEGRPRESARDDSPEHSDEGQMKHAMNTLDAQVSVRIGGPPTCRKLKTGPGTGHDAPLRLVTGADRRLARLARLTAVAGLSAILLADATPAWKALLTALLTATWSRLENLEAHAPGVPLVVLPDGRGRLGGTEIRIEPRYWYSRWYCVLACEGSGRRRLLVSASRQERGEYRKLLGWMRLRNRADSKP